MLSACSAAPSAYMQMENFRLAYGIERVIFSPSVPEGEAGYTEEGFLDRLFGDISGCVSDFAVLFTSDLTAVGECAVLACYSRYDAITVTEAALMRLNLLRAQAGSLDTSALDTAFVRREGNTVILCALGDNERAGRLFDKIF